MQGTVLRPSDAVAVLASIDPDAYAASTVVTGWISAKMFDSFMAIVQVGDLGSSATIDAKLRQATDGSGSGAKDIAGKAITQLTQAGTDSNKQAIINLRSEELDVAGGFKFFELSMTVATATSDAGAIVLGLTPRFGPASDNDAAAVDEIVG